MILNRRPRAIRQEKLYRESAVEFSFKRFGRCLTDIERNFLFGLLAKLINEI